jgi:RNA polymerase-binding transcription factor DksA
MATKKKAAKTAKKATGSKKPVPVKKAAAKPARHHPITTKKLKKPSAKNLVKASLKKPAHVKKSTAVKKPAIKTIARPSAGKSTAHVKHPAPRTDAKKTLAKLPEKRPEIRPVTPPPTVVKHEPKKAAPPAKPVKVVIPEIKTKTVRKYEPEFTKSVLDTLQQDSTGPTMRYSDSELTEFRELIMKKLDAAKKELTYLQGLITRKDEMGGDDTDNRYMTMEDGSMSMEREQLSQMASRQITFIDHLEKALMRIENKTYGICRVTGKLIDKARLRAVPHATLSIEAKQTMNK